MSSGICSLNGFNDVYNVMRAQVKAFQYIIELQFASDKQMLMLPDFFDFSNHQRHHVNCLNKLNGKRQINSKALLLVAVLLMALCSP